jgi:hypothetical protein
MMFEGKIDYKILPDGTCSHCGKPADMIPLPDGDVTRSDCCVYCDNYNEELRLDRAWIDNEPNDFGVSPRG